MAVNPQFLSDIQLAISTAPETDINIPYALAADFEGVLCDQVVPNIPNLNIINDSDQVGDGTEFAKNPRPYNWSGSQVSLASKLNTEWNARMLKRFLGGVVTDSVVSAGAVWDHAIVMQLRTQRIPQLTTLAMLLGGADPILSSMAVNAWEVTQARTEEPRCSVELMGSGHHSRFRDVYRIQVVTITGTPTGGTFSLTFAGQTTAGIAFNANAAAVLSALEALSNIAVGDISVTGGPGPGTPYVVTFLTTGAYANADVALMTASGALLTGGSSPAVAVTPQVVYLVPPAPPTHHYMHGATLLAVLNNGTAIDLTDEGMLNYSIRMVQNIEWESLPGQDLFMIPGDVNSGAYMGVVFRGARTVEPQVTIYLDDTLDEYYWTRKNLDITDLKFTSKGQKIGATAFQHEVEINIPISKQSSLALGAEGPKGTKTLTFLPTKDPVTTGIATARVRNGFATLL